MRQTPARLLGVLAAVGILLTGAGCGLHGARETAAACQRIQQEVQDLLTLGAQPGDPDQLAEQFTASAARVRDEGAKAGGDVEQTADKLATAIDETAAYYASLSSGAVQAPDYSSVSGITEESSRSAKAASPDTAKGGSPARHQGRRAHPEPVAVVGRTPA